MTFEPRFALGSPEPVDLLSGPLEWIGGIVSLRDGRVFYSMAVGSDADGEIEVRIENGVYYGYERDGRRCDLKVIDGQKRWVHCGEESGMDIVAFTRCDFNDPRVAGLLTEVTP